MTKSEFQVGDIVRKLNGKLPAQITSKIYSDRFYCHYLGSGNPFSAYSYDLVLYEDPTETQTMKTLYTFEENGKTIFANVIGKTQDGNLVLEARGGGGIFTKAESEVVEVIPYTVEIEFLTGGKNSVHYEARQDALVKGDFVVSDQGQFGRVKAVDTKNKSARGKFAGRKLVTEPIA